MLTVSQKSHICGKKYTKVSYVRIFDGQLATYTIDFRVVTEL